MKTKIRFWMPAILFALSSVFLTNCKGDATIPVVSTNEATAVTNATATSGGIISDDGGATVTARGVCWSTSQTPTIADNITSDGTGAGSFISAITGLTANTTYYLRAYATNSAGTGYGNVTSFTTKKNVIYGSFTDSRDGYVYKTVKIGNQVWMAENLRYLPSVVGPETVSDETPYYYVYDYNGTNVSEAKATANYKTYGVLYNWHAAVEACPPGWHLPTTTEWYELIEYLGGEDVAVACKKMKYTDFWADIDGESGNGTNESGFSALPGGDCWYEFSSIGEYGLWWTSTVTGFDGYNIIMCYYGDVFSDCYDMGSGHSIRYVKN